MDHITSKGEPQYQQSYCAAALQYKETQGEKKKTKTNNKTYIALANNICSTEMLYTSYLGSMTVLFEELMT